MSCDGQIVEDDQVHPLTEEQVLEICGEPTERDGERWIYEDQGKVLRFNDAGELEAIDDAPGQ